METIKQRNKWIAWTLVAAMIVSVLCTGTMRTDAASSKKKTVTKAGITYQITSTSKKTAKVVKAKKTITKATIPATVKIGGTSYKVTAIAKNAFKTCTKLKSVTIGKNVKTIGANAFYKDKKLSKILITSKSLKKIGKKAFGGIKKTAVFYVYKAKSKTYKKLIKKSAAGWKKTMKVRIEDSGAKVTKSGITYQVTSASRKTAKVMKAKTTITKAVIPATVKIKGTTYKVTAIGKNAFKKCTKLKSVTIGKNVKTIGANAFYGDKKLSKITIKATGLKTIGKNAFYGIKKSAVIKVPSAQKSAYKKLLTKKTGWKSTMTLQADGSSTAVDKDATAYTYEVTALSDDICYYFYVKTDNPDPTSFDFVDKDTVYADDGEYGYLTRCTTQYADVVYTDTDTLRVNGGYIFTGSYTDGGTLYLEKVTDGTRETTDIKVTLPELKSGVDYLIDTYTNNAMTFFEKMDAIETGLNDICLYSGAYVLGTLQKSTTSPYYGLSTSPHVDQSFYIQDPYYRTDSRYMLVTQLYPYILDSLGFPSMMSRAAKKLNSSATVEWSSYAHYLVNVTLDGTTKTYGGAGTGGGQGIEEDMITYWYKFDGTSSDTSTKTGWTDIETMIKAYGALDVEDVTDADELTWEKVAKTVGTDGSYVRLVLLTSIYFGSSGDGYAFLYQASESSTYVSYFSDAWYDGRYFNSHEYFEKGTTFEDQPTATIVMKDVTITFPDAPEGETYLYGYQTIDQASKYDADTGTWSGFTYFYYDEDTETWIASIYSNSKCRVLENGSYTYSNIEDQDFIDACTLTKAEVEAMNIDENANTDPTTYYIYDMKSTPGTLVTGE